MKKQGVIKRLSCLCLALLLVLSLVACKDQADEQDSQPPTSSTITPTEAPTPTPAPTPSIPYTDVPSDAYYYDAVVWAYQNGIASDGTTFNPASACTRGQVVTSLWRAMGSPEPQIAENPISDISPDDWYYKPALWAYESGIITNTIFNSGNPCTNAEIITILWRTYGEPAAAVYSSPVSLAHSGKYYTRAVAWADNGGMFAGMDSVFDPAAPCSRADLMMYLYWATEQWAFTEEDKAIQAEYEQIIKDAQLYEVHGSGLLYADYVDVDGDGKVELLTLETSADKSYHEYEITATLYADIDGHARKSCNQTFSWSWDEESLYICKNGNNVCLRNTWLHMGTSSEGDVFFKIEKEAFEINESISVSYASDKPEYTGITEAEYNVLDQKYTDKKELLRYDRGNGISVHDRGLLPVPGVEVNGTVVQVSSISEGVFMVSLRDLLDAMGVAIYANSDASVILASTKSDTLVITNLNYPFDEMEYFNMINTQDYYYRYNTYKCYMNGSEHKDIAVNFIDGKAFISLQTVVPLFGATAEWSGETGTMRITSNIPDSNRMSQSEINAMASFSFDETVQTIESHGYTVYYRGGASYGILRIENGNSIWSTWVFDEIPGNYEEILVYPVEVTNNGKITAHPEQASIRLYPGL